MHKPFSNIITLSEMTGEELVCYKTGGKNSLNDHIATLSKLPNGSYGFINLGNSNCKPVFQEPTRECAIQTAATSRQLYVFESQKDLISAIYNENL